MHLQFVKIVQQYIALLHEYLTCIFVCVCVCARARARSREHMYVPVYSVAYFLNKDCFKQGVERKRNKFYRVYTVRSHNRVNMLELCHTYIS